MLFQNFPNPFNPLTTIEYSVAKASPVELTIYDVRGQGVRTLVRENRLAGKYAAVWDGKNDGGRPISTGVYFCRLEIGSFVSVKKMVLLK
jgi:flagellar hook assembly protein FlgD